MNRTLPVMLKMATTGAERLLLVLVVEPETDAVDQNVEIVYGMFSSSSPFLI